MAVEMDDVLVRAGWPTISGEVQATYSKHFAQYCYIKYPAQDYQRFKQTFSAFKAGVEMASALLWKRGHWGKASYPSKQAALITEISALWGGDLNWARALNEAPSSKVTFQWWSRKLGRLRYITSAYLTHLVLPRDVPIIDQHNFRAMNHLHRVQQPKIKPSDWSDIAQLKRFLTEANSKLQYAEGDFDKYLMMYGRALKPIQPKTSSKEHA